jgi:leucyl-tRNA synthetase
MARSTRSIRTTRSDSPSAGRVDRYVPQEIEPRWQARWADQRRYEVDVERVAPAEKFYNLVEFPYPSAEGLHVGHVYTYCGADTYGRFLRMAGRTVFQPMGFDSFGIHTENFALKVGEHPMRLTAKTIENYRRQLMRMGAGFDWSRQVVTSDPQYYRWTQWVFLQLYRAGLAAREEAPAVWCPSCRTVLAFEQLEGDRCERCGSVVTQRVMQQWFLRITAYADELAAELDHLDWPDEAKRRQRDWIGRSEGVEIDFPVVGHGDVVLSTFTTRPDTLPNVTFLVLPPTHPTLARLVEGSEREAEVRSFIEEMAGRAPVRRGGGGGEAAPGSPRGVFTGAVATNPATGHDVPVWVADYVVEGYGTGAVMGVPSQDDGDREFAQVVGLPMAPTPAPPAMAQMKSSCEPSFGTTPEEAARWLEDRGLGRRTVSYRLHDWLISRQRYWGPPIPIVYCEGCGTVPVPEDQLPVLLPDVEEFRPTGTGTSPLASVDEFVHTTCPSCGGPARRETDVSDTFFDSSWYFLRYPSTDVHEQPWNEERTARMLPVDLYAGGPEHVARHHLYARFVTRALHDLGLVPFAEPFPKLRLHGTLVFGGAKMSKSRGNVVNPDEYVERVGADNLRMYLLFCGPWEQGGEFSDEGLAGIERFTRRAWRLIVEPHEPGTTSDMADAVDLRPLDRAIAKVTSDIETLQFNTAISTLMDTVRWARRTKASMTADAWDRTARTVVVLLAPFAPHLAEELWSRFEGTEGSSVHDQRWPTADPRSLEDPEVTIVVEVNGRARDRLVVPRDTGRDEVLIRALASDRVQRHLPEGPPRDVVFVPNRVVNLLT